MTRTRRFSLAHLMCFGLLSLSIFLAGPVCGQDFPTKFITLFCGYEPGASTDITGRILASEAEKFLGVPIVVENKPGGTTTVCASLVASKKPDGYTLGYGSSQVITAAPHMMNLSYHPFKDLIPVMQYSHYLSGLVVLNESPFKTMNDLIAHSKANPGTLSYGSTGMYGTSHLSTVQLLKCKGLQIKHVPFKGGAPLSTAMMGKHVDMGTSGDRLIPYVKKGVMRLLVNYNIEKRDPMFPDVPIMSDLGCQDVPAHRIFIFGPAGMPDPISTKLADAFRKAAETPRFQQTLKDFHLPYSVKSRSQLEKELPKEYEFLKNFLNELGVKKGSQS